jgi:hypothetical protein
MYLVFWSSVPKSCPKIHERFEISKKIGQNHCTLLHTAASALPLSRTASAQSTRAKEEGLGGEKKTMLSVPGQPCPSRAVAATTATAAAAAAATAAAVEAPPATDATSSSSNSTSSNSSFSCCSSPPADPSAPPATVAFQQAAVAVQPAASSMLKL